MNEHQPEFTVRNARVRYNPRLGEEIGMQVFDDGATTLVGVLGLGPGWTAETAEISDCHFERDESLPPGCIVFEPFVVRSIHDTETPPLKVGS